MIKLVSSLLIIVAILTGGSTVFLFKVSQVRLKLILAFTGAYLLAITFLTILPEMYGSGTDYLKLGLFMLGGFMVQVFLESFSHGIEHGHVHIHPEGKSKYYVLSLSVGLYIHSFLEGIPLSLVDRFDHPLLWGIILHNLPIAFAYTWMLKGMQVKNSILILYLLIFSIVTPMGMLLGHLLSGYSFIHDFEVIALALTTGIFLHISTTILFETGENHKYNFRKMAVILAGIGLALLPHLIE